MSSRCHRALVPRCLSVCLMLVGAWAHAQSGGTPSTPSTPDANAQLSDIERAKRDADKVFQWIKFHAEKGEAKKTDKNEKNEKHEAKAEAKPEPKPAPAAAVAKAPPAPTPAPAARKPDAEPDTKVAAKPEAKTVAAAPAADTNAARGAVPVTAGAQPSLPAPAPVPSRGGPEVVAMAAPSTVPAVGGAAPLPAPAATPLPEEDTPLQLVSRVDPEYPRSLLQQQRNGSVMVRFTVMPDGTVEGAEALRSPDRKLSVAAVNAVKQWRFAPINRSRQVSVEIGFQME